MCFWEGGEIYLNTTYGTHGTYKNHKRVTFRKFTVRVFYQRNLNTYLILIACAIYIAYISLIDKN